MDSYQGSQPCVQYIAHAHHKSYQPACQCSAGDANDPCRVFDCLILVRSLHRSPISRVSACSIYTSRPWAVHSNLACTGKSYISRRKTRGSRMHVKLRSACQALTMLASTANTLSSSDITTITYNHSHHHLSASCGAFNDKGDAAANRVCEAGYVRAKHKHNTSRLEGAQARRLSLTGEPAPPLPASAIGSVSTLPVP